jgi:hypothetical protein
MSLEADLARRLVRALSVLDERGSTGPRLVDDADRLWRRIQKLLALDLIPAVDDLSALRLCCFALQLPFAWDKSRRGQPPARPRLKDRAELAIGLLPNFFTESGADELLLGRALELLEQMPDRAPKSPEAKLLADAVNLEDFGACGLIAQAFSLFRQGEGLTQLIDGAEKREQYGYWDARLKDGFHFESVRHMARARLENARIVSSLLRQEDEKVREPKPEQHER